MRRFELEDEARLQRGLEGIKPRLVEAAESLVKQSGIYSQRDFGKRQMNLLLSVASAEIPEVVVAWMKGQIGKAPPGDGWRTKFGAGAIEAVASVRRMVENAVRDVGGWGERCSQDDAVRELWHRSLALFFGFARWQMLYLNPEISAEEPGKRSDRPHNPTRG